MDAVARLALIRARARSRLVLPPWRREELSSLVVDLTPWEREDFARSLARSPLTVWFAAPRYLE